MLACHISLQVISSGLYLDLAQVVLVLFTHSFQKLSFPTCSSLIIDHDLWIFEGRRAVSDALAEQYRFPAHPVRFPGTRGSTTKPGIVDGSVPFFFKCGWANCGAGCPWCVLCICFGGYFIDQRPGSCSRPTNEDVFVCETPMISPTYSPFNRTNPKLLLANHTYMQIYLSCLRRRPTFFRRPPRQPQPSSLCPSPSQSSS